MKQILAAALLTILPASPLAGQADTAAAYGVRAGDQVETIFYTAGGESLAQVTGNRIVDRDGNLFYPFVGTVHVSGLDAAAIRNLLVDKFTPFYKDPVVTVNVKLKVNITGVVTNPGHYLLDPTTTVADALATAGGTGFEFTANFGGGVPADLEHVRILREGQAIVLDLRPESADTTPLTMRVQSGDWIFVPARARSQIRDDISFWSGIVGVVTTLVGVVALFTR